MSLFKKRSEYFKSLAKRNKLIAHEHQAGKEKRASFFRMNDEEEVVAACSNFAHFPCMVQYGFGGRFTTAFQAVPKQKITNALLFLYPANASNMDSIEDAYDIAFEAMEQVISAMYAQYSEKGYCGNFYNLDLGRFSYTPIGPINLNLYGWDLVFEDEQSAGGVTKYDASKWFE